MMTGNGLGGIRDFCVRINVNPEEVPVSQHRLDRGIVPAIEAGWAEWIQSVMGPVEIHEQKEDKKPCKNRHSHPLSLQPLKQPVESVRRQHEQAEGSGKHEFLREAEKGEEGVEDFVGRSVLAQGEDQG